MQSPLRLRKYIAYIKRPRYDHEEVHPEVVEPEQGRGRKCQYHNSDELRARNSDEHRVSHREHCVFDSLPACSVLLLIYILLYYLIPELDDRVSTELNCESKTRNQVDNGYSIDLDLNDEFMSDT